MSFDKLEAKPLLAEFLGTFFLAFAVLSSINNPDFPIGTPLIAGTTVMIFVYAVGGISGAHINPAVTLGLLSVGEISIFKAIGYWLVQFAAGGAAMSLGMYCFPEAASLTVENNFGIGHAEATGAFVLLFGIMAVVTGRAHDAVSGLVIGASLVIGISLAAPLSNAVLNPAVAVGISSVSVAYFVGPLVGAIAGAWIGKIALSE